MTAWIIKLYKCRRPGDSQGEVINTAKSTTCEDLNRHASLRDRDGASQFRGGGHADRRRTGGRLGAACHAIVADGCHLGGHMVHEEGRENSNIESHHLKPPILIRMALGLHPTMGRPALTGEHGQRVLILGPYTAESAFTYPVPSQRSRTSSSVRNRESRRHQY